MHKKFEVNRTKIKGGCQLYTKAAPQQSWSDLTLSSCFAPIPSSFFSPQVVKSTDDICNKLSFGQFNKNLDCSCYETII